VERKVIVVVTTNKGMDDIQTETGRHIRLWLQLQKRVGTMYQQEVEREGNVSDCGCDYKTRAETMYSLEGRG
jgi:hypothetical protein